MLNIIQFNNRLMLLVKIKLNSSWVSSLSYTHL